MDNIDSSRQTTDLDRLNESVRKHLQAEFVTTIPSNLSDAQLSNLKSFLKEVIVRYEELWKLDQEKMAAGEDVYKSECLPILRSYQVLLLGVYQEQERRA